MDKRWMDISKRGEGEPCSRDEVGWLVGGRVGDRKIGVGKSAVC